MPAARSAAAALLLCAGAAADGGAYQELVALLRKNKDAYDISWSPPGLPPAAFQDHIAFDLVTLYRLGANSSQLDSAFAYHEQTELLAKAVVPTGKITDSNWKDRIGEDAQMMPLYSDYVEYYRARLAASTPQAVIDAHLPALVDGIFGKLYHGLLAVGWVYAEAGSSDSESLAQGLAWMSSAYSPPVPLGAAVKPTAGALAATLAAMRADKALPVFQGDPQKLYFVFLGDLCANFSTNMQGYDLDFPATGTLREAQAVADDMAGAVLDLFAANNFTSYTHVHIIEAVRAARSVLAMLKDTAARATLLKRVWQSVLFNFAIQNRPASAPAAAFAAPTRPMREVVAGALLQGDTHLHNTVWMAADNQKTASRKLWHTAADSALAIFEGNGTWSF